MAYPYSQVFEIFNAAATDTTTTLPASASAAGALQVHFDTTGFSGTVDFQGRLSAKDAWSNLLYVVVAAGALTPAVAQLSFSTSTAAIDYIITNPMPNMQVVMTRSAGSIVATGRTYEAPFSLSLGGVSGTVSITGLPAAAAAADGFANPTTPNLMEMGMAFNGTSWDRVRNSSAASLSAATQPYAQVVSLPGMWSVTHAPAANNIATISKAAGTGSQRHVCTALSFVATAGATPPTAGVLTVNLRDGATGAGTILKTWTIGITATAGVSQGVALSGLNIPGSAATAMTLEFTGTGSNIYESVEMSGYLTA